jgi:MFS family permease
MFRQPSLVRPQSGATRDRSFALYFWSRVASEFAIQIGLVAVGWQIYAMTRSAMDLGLVGLAEFLPTLVLSLAAGHVADRCDRRRLVQICQATKALAALGLAGGTMTGRLNIQEIFAAVALIGAADAFEAPAAAAMLNAVATRARIQKAAALVTGAFQVATLAGPALGGLLYGIMPSAPYAAMAVLWLAASLLIGGMSIKRNICTQAAPTLTSVLAGVTFVRRNPAILGTISLDLFVVLLGGATTLLPIFARDILHTGPLGLGLLRGAPGLGALAMAAALSRWPITRKAGLRLFQAIIVFGLATAVFALSRSVLLSVAALAVLGAADAVSMVIRVALVQLATPDDMRGRVGAVNFLFVGASYQLGGFESGVTAALLGAAPAALIGGLGTVAVALLWMRLFPALRNIERVDQTTAPNAQVDGP